MQTPQSSSEEKYPVPKAALVTGAAKRIGRAIALDLADAGYAVAVHYNASVEDAEDLVNLIKARDGKAISLRADLTREADVRMLMNMAVEALGPIGCLVNNASVFEYDAPETATRESWDEHMEANLRAPFVLMQQMTFALPQDAGGVIINLLDNAFDAVRAAAAASGDMIRSNASGPDTSISVRFARAHVVSS